MHELIVRDDGQLRRIERAIAAIEARPPAAQRAQQRLLEALLQEREELLKINRSARPPRRFAA